MIRWEQQKARQLLRALNILPKKPMGLLGIITAALCATLLVFLLWRLLIMRRPLPRTTAYSVMTLALSLRCPMTIRGGILLPVLPVMLGQRFLLWTLLIIGMMDVVRVIPLRV